MTSPIFFRPAIPLLIALICGILSGSELGGGEIWLGAIVVVSTVCVLRQAYRRHNGLLFALLLFFALGYLSITPWLEPRFPTHHIIHYAGAERWNITGTIVNQPQITNNRTRFILRVSNLADLRQSHNVTGKLRVTIVGQPPRIAVGDELRLNSRLRLITNFKNPGGFDYRRYMAFKGVWTTAYVRGDRLVVTNRHRPLHLIEFVDSARRTLADLIDRSGGSAAGAVLKALIIGDRAQISPPIRQAFNRAGVGHLLAISGLHIGIVATVAFVLFHALMVRVKFLLWKAGTRKVAALLSLLPVIFYGTLAGFSPSTQRAVIMVSVFLLTFLFESEQDPLNTLALAALLILVADPPALFSISFQLSFSAVFAILYGLSRLQPRDALQPKPLPASWFFRVRSKLVSFLLVSFLAICGSLPLVAYYFNQVSLIGLAANFVVVPLIGFVTIPLGLMGLFVLPLSVALASWCIKASLLILSFSLNIVTLIADLPFAAVKVVTPSLLEILCFYIMGWTLLNLRILDRPAIIPPPSDCGAGDPIKSTTYFRPPWSGSGILGKILKIPSPLAGNGPRSVKAVHITLVTVLMILILDAGYWLYQRYGSSDLRVTIIDVGDGSASLLELPGGYTILVDGGGFSDNSAFDVGEKIVAPLLWRNKIRTVDTLILSHPNSDHLNGLIYIARYFNVKNVWSNNEPHDTRGYAKFMEVIAQKNIRLAAFKDLPRRHRIGGVELDILYPPPEFLKFKETQKWRNANNNSLVVKATFESISFLFPGDIMADAEKELVRLAGRNLPSSVLIAPHHGSKTSNSKIFIEAVNPEVVILSSSRNGRFKFPHRTTLNRYSRQGCSIWRTDLNGAIHLSTDGRHLHVKAFSYEKICCNSIDSADAFWVEYFDCCRFPVGCGHNGFGAGRADYRTANTR
jgi:competence protein ComEC